MRRNPSVALPRLVVMEAVAEASRCAVRTFLAMGPDEVSLSDWLAGPYREATSFDPRRASRHSPVHLDAGATLRTATDLPIPDLVTVAKTRVVSALGAAQRGIDDLLQHLPPIVHVEPAHDSYGNHGFIPVDEANMHLVDRVLALLVVDYLTRPDDYASGRHPFSDDDPRLWLAPRPDGAPVLRADARRR